MEKLGLMMQVCVFAVASCPSPEQMQEILRGLVDKIGMTTGGLNPQVWHYPFEGMGGEGETLIQPFATVQPLMESISASLGLAAGDTWREHGGTYIIIASCRPYSVWQARKYLQEQMGPVLDFGEAPVVYLRPGRPTGRAFCG